MSHPSHPRDLKKQVNRSLKARDGGPLPFKKNTIKATRTRDLRAAEWPDFEERRDRITERRQQAVDGLKELHESLRKQWSKHGITIHDAADAADARAIITSILHQRGISEILKSKSMLSEEIEINNHLVTEGIEPLETDLGEYIVQLRNEAPSHITMPGMHLFRQDVGQLFADKLGIPYTEDPSELTKIARKVLRQRFLHAPAGMIGVNFAVAETGHLVTVTNEGNGRMVNTLPPVVIALMGWERVTQSMADLGELWQILARSATGQRATSYLSLLQGPSQGPGGPGEVHLVIVDNGRKAIHEDPEAREVLRCIRCGACLNACPVYQQVGGHPYGGTYPGPIGSVLTPLLNGPKEAPHHPFASSLCGACEEVCPVKIPLPKMLLEGRKQRVDSRGSFDPEKPIWAMFRWMMTSRYGYEATTKLARLGQSLIPGHQVPLPGWSDHRDSPMLAPKPFRDLFDSWDKEKA
ncbi:lactate utilization protein [bacterium]|nr:lactate utilization protein [bacterium]